MHPSFFSTGGTKITIESKHMKDKNNRANARTYKDFERDLLSQNDGKFNPTYEEYLRANYDWIDKIPYEYKNRLFNNPYWNTYINYSPSNWDVIFHGAKVENNRNSLRQQVDTYISDVYNDWQKYIQNSSGAQKEQDILAGINPVFQDYSGAGGPVESQDNTNPVDLSDTSGEESLAVIQTALTAISAAMTNGISLVANMANNALTKANTESVNRDVQLKKMNIMSSAFKFIRDNSDIFMTDSRDSEGHLIARYNFDNIPSSGDFEIDSYIKSIASDYAISTPADTQANKAIDENKKTLHGLLTTDATLTAIGGSDESDLRQFYALYGEANKSFMLASMISQKYNALLTGANAASDLDYLNQISNLSGGKSYGTLAAESDYYQIQMQKQINEFTAKARNSLFQITNYVFDKAAEGKRWAQALSLGLGGATLFTPTFNFNQRQQTNPVTGMAETLNGVNASINLGQ